MKKAVQWLLAVIVTAGSGTCVAQSVNAGDIRGTVIDPTGAVIPGVSVNVLNVDTGVSKDYVTNAAGLYDTNSGSAQESVKLVDFGGFCGMGKIVYSRA